METFVRSHERMLRILDLFDQHSPEWTFDALHEELGYSRSTLYRYLKTLTDAGLLTSFPELGYTLGPRIIEFDYLMRTSDPLIRAARPVMEELVSSLAGVSLLCRRYRQLVLCVHQESSAPEFRSNYERGKARPLLRGAASLAILAYFSAYQLARLYEQSPQAFHDAGLGESLAEVRANLRAVRQNGWISTLGQVTPGVLGIAAPILDANDEIVGSLSLTIPEPNVADERIKTIGEQILFGARIVSKSLR